MADKIKISDSETIILKILLEVDEPISVSSIISHLKEKRINWAYTTVSTFLIRMRKKKLVDIKKQGKTYYYYPIIKQDEVINSAKNFVEKYFQGSLFNFLTAFSQNTDLSSKDIEDLKKWVKRLDENNK